MLQLLISKYVEFSPWGGLKEQVYMLILHPSSITNERTTYYYFITNIRRKLSAYFCFSCEDQERSFTLFKNDA